MHPRHPANPYVGDAFALAQYRRARDAWIAGGRKGPPPVPPRAAHNPAGGAHPAWGVVGGVLIGAALGAGGYHLWKMRKGDSAQNNPRTKNP